MKNKILKNDIAEKIKKRLDPILVKENIFKSGEFDKTNIRITDLKKRKGFLEFNNTDIHYEVFFNDREQTIYVEIHFKNGAKDLFEKISSSNKFPTELELGESARGAEKIIRLRDKGIPYSEDYNKIANEINEQLKQLKNLIDQLLNLIDGI